MQDDEMTRNVARGKVAIPERLRFEKLDDQGLRRQHERGAKEEFPLTVKTGHAHVEAGLPDVSVAEAVSTFAEAKKAEGMSGLYLKDIRLLLGRFASHFQCNIATIQPEDLSAYLGAMKVGPVAKNNHRRMLVALFNFAKGEGWLRANEETAAQRLGAYKEKEREVEI